MLLARLLDPFIRVGRLTVIDARGGRHVFGSEETPAVTIRLHDPALHWRMALQPELCAGEAYTAGTLTVEDASLYDFLDLVGRNLDAAGRGALKGPLGRLRPILRRVRQFNPARRAHRNVAHHYDLSGELYDLFLDEDRQYSCAYFAAPDDDLETAQRRKRRHLAAKLLLEPGMRVLDIGCGWGGLALYLAGTGRAGEVLGITLSQEQLAFAQARAARSGLAAKVRFEL
jgi:cyclopropane-fatty-acyl-phospholipid synthase